MIVNPSFYHFFLDEYSNSSFGNVTDDALKEYNDIFNYVGKNVPNETLKQMLKELSSEQTANLNYFKLIVARVKHIMQYGAYRETLEGREVIQKSNAFNVKSFKKILKREEHIIGQDFDIEMLQSMQTTNKEKPDVLQKAFLSFENATIVLFKAAADVWIQNCAQDGKNADIILCGGIIGHMIVLHMQPAGGIITICNTGAGVQFHPAASQLDIINDGNVKAAASSAATDTRRQLVAQVEHVPHKDMARIIQHMLVLHVNQSDQYSTYVITSTQDFYTEFLSKFMKPNVFGKPTLVCTAMSNKYEFTPQKSGSCTFYSLYYFARFYFRLALARSATKAALHSGTSLNAAQSSDEHADTLFFLFRKYMFQYFYQKELLPFLQGCTARGAMTSAQYTLYHVLLTKCQAELRVCREDTSYHALNFQLHSEEEYANVHTWYHAIHSLLSPQLLEMRSNVHPFLQMQNVTPIALLQRGIPNVVNTVKLYEALESAPTFVAFVRVYAAGGFDSVYKTYWSHQYSISYVHEMWMWKFIQRNDEDAYFKTKTDAEIQEAMAFVCRHLTGHVTKSRKIAIQMKQLLGVYIMLKINDLTETRTNRFLQNLQADANIQTLKEFADHAPEEYKLFRQYFGSTSIEYEHPTLVNVEKVLTKLVHYRTYLVSHPNFHQTWLREFDPKLRVIKTSKQPMKKSVKPANEMVHPLFAWMYTDPAQWSKYSVELRAFAIHLSAAGPSALNRPFVAASAVASSSSQLYTLKAFDFFDIFHPMETPLLADFGEDNEGTDILVSTLYTKEYVLTVPLQLASNNLSASNQARHQKLDHDVLDIVSLGSHSDATALETHLMYLEQNNDNDPFYNPFGSTFKTIRWPSLQSCSHVTFDCLKNPKHLPDTPEEGSGGDTYESMIQNMLQHILPDLCRMFTPYKVTLHEHARTIAVVFYLLFRYCVQIPRSNLDQLLRFVHSLVRCDSETSFLAFYANLKKIESHTGHDLLPADLKSSMQQLHLDIPWLIYCHLQVQRGVEVDLDRLSTLLTKYETLTYIVGTTHVPVLLAKGGTRLMLVHMSRRLLLSPEHGLVSSLRPIVQRYFYEKLSHQYRESECDVVYYAVNDTRLLAPANALPSAAIYHKLTHERIAVVYDCTQYMNQHTQDIRDHFIMTDNPYTLPSAITIQGKQSIKLIGHSMSAQYPYNVYIEDDCVHRHLYGAKFTLCQVPHDASVLSQSNQLMSGWKQNHWVCLSRLNSAQSAFLSQTQHNAQSKNDSSNSGSTESMQMMETSMVVAVIELKEYEWEFALGSDGRLYDATLTYVVVTDAPNVLMRWVHAISGCALLQNVRIPEEYRIMIVVPHRLQSRQTSSVKTNNVAFEGGPPPLSFGKDAGVKLLTLSRNGLHCYSDSGVRTLAAYMVCLWGSGRFELVHTLIHQLLHGLSDLPKSGWPEWLTQFVSLLEHNKLGCPYRLFYRAIFSLVKHNRQVNPYTQNLQGRQLHYPLCYRPLDAIKDAQSATNVNWMYTHAFEHVANFVNDPALRTLMTATHVLLRVSSPSLPMAERASLDVKKSNFKEQSLLADGFGDNSSMHMDTTSPKAVHDDLYISEKVDADMAAYRAVVVQTDNVKDEPAFNRVVLESAAPLALHLKHITNTRREAMHQLSDALTLQCLDVDYTHTRFVRENAKILYTLLECDVLASILQKVIALFAKSQRARTTVNGQELHNCMKMLASSEYGIYQGPRSLTIVVFETCFENFILKSQHALFTKIRASLMQPNAAWMSTYQLLMGKGKTSVLTPLLVLDMQLRRNKDTEENIVAQDVFLVLPAHLVQQSLNMFRTRYSNILPHMSVVHVEVGRAFDISLHFSQTFQHLGGQHNKFFIVSDGTIKSVQLNLVELQKHSNHGMRQTDHFLYYFAKQCVYLFDEVDTLMNPTTSELNYPVDGHTRIHDQDMLENAVLAVLTFMYEQNMLHTVHETVESANAYLLNVMEDFVDLNGNHTAVQQTYFLPLLYYVSLWAPSVNASQKPRKYHHYAIDALSLNSNQVYCMHRMVRTIAFALTWIYNKDYGFGSDSPAFAQKNSLVAIPYQAVNHPADGSEFSELTLNLVLTTLSYLHQTMNTVREQDMRVFQHMLEKEYEGLSGNWSLFIQSKYVRGVLGYCERPNSQVSGAASSSAAAVQLSVGRLDQVDFREMGRYIAQHQHARQCFVHIYVKHYIFKHFVQINCGQLNTSFLDIASTCFTRQRVGFSGTVHVPEPQFVPAGDSYKAVKLSLSQITEDVMSNGGMQCAMRGTYNPKMKVLFRHADANMAAAANKACHWNTSSVCMCGLQTSADVRLVCHAVSAGYDALIDAGAFLRNLSSLEVARLIRRFLKETHQEKKHVIYIDEQDRLYRFADVLTNEVAGGSQRNAPMDVVHPYNNELVNEPLFLYYDHRHIVGIDIKQPFSMYGLTTVNYFNTYTEVAQAIFRLRNMNSGHCVDFVLFDNFISTYNLLATGYNAMRSTHMKDKVGTSSEQTGSSAASSHQLSISMPPVHQIQVSTNSDTRTVGVSQVVMFLHMKEEENYDQMKTQLTIQTLKMLTRYHSTQDTVNVQMYKDLQFNEKVTTMLSFSRDNKALTWYTDWIRSHLCKPHAHFQVEIAALCSHLHHASVKTLINGRATHQTQNQAHARVRDENQSQHLVQSIHATKTIALSTTLKVETHHRVQHYINFYIKVSKTGQHPFVPVLVNTERSPDPSAAPPSPLELTGVEKLRDTLQAYDIYVTTLFLQRLADSLRFPDLAVWQSQGLFYLREEDSYLLLSQYEMSALVLHQRVLCKERNANPTPLDTNVDVADALGLTAGYDRYGNNWNTLDVPVHSKRAVDAHAKSALIQLLLGKQMDAFERMRLIFHCSISEDHLEAVLNVVHAFEVAMERTFLTAETLELEMGEFLRNCRTMSWTIFTKYLAVSRIFTEKSPLIKRLCGLKSTTSEDYDTQLREQLLGYQRRIEDNYSRLLTVTYVEVPSGGTHNNGIKMIADDHDASTRTYQPSNFKRQRSPTELSATAAAAASTEKRNQKMTKSFNPVSSNVTSSSPRTQASSQW
jgi:hypothetical protein